MTVVFVTATYPTPERPAFGVFVREHARAAATVCDVAVLHLDRAPPARGLYDITAVEGEPVPTWRVRYRGLPRPGSYAAAVAGLRAATRQIGPTDVVHAHTLLAAAPAMILASLLRRPLVYTEQWSVFLPEDPARLGRGMRLVARLALRRADAVLPVSDSLRRALSAIDPNARFRIVRNAVDGSVFFPGVEPPHGRVRLLSVGLMDDGSKGIDVLLDAFARVREDAHLDLVGDGALRASYELQAERLGISPRVRFHGLRSKPEIATMMREAHAFVLASRFDNNPVVLLEALVSGLPVVATRVSGIPEIVGEFDGALTTAGDPAAIASTLDSVIARLEQFHRTEIARRARAAYGLEAIGRQLGEVYQGVAASGANFHPRGYDRPS